MKKIFALVSMAAIMTACNNDSSEKAATTDSITAAESPLMDAVNTADSAKMIMQDSTFKLIDTTQNK